MQLLQIDFGNRLIASGIVRKPYANHTWHKPVDGFFPLRNAVEVKIKIFGPCYQSINDTDSQEAKGQSFVQNYPDKLYFIK